MEREKMKGKKYFIIISGLILLHLLATPLLACKGRLLNLAVGNSPDQLIMGKMLSIMINERTGTTVEIVQVEDIKAAHEAVLNGLAEIYINYIGMAQVLQSKIRHDLAETLRIPRPAGAGDPFRKSR
jgi:glycine betaine/choline ABC-type transport system substrate-binding protein